MTKDCHANALLSVSEIKYYYYYFIHGLNNHFKTAVVALMIKLYFKVYKCLRCFSSCPQVDNALIWVWSFVNLAVVHSLG